MMIFMIFFLFTCTNADILLDAYKENTEHSVNSCDNFYRHACPLGLSDSENVDGRFLNVMNDQSNPAWSHHFKSFESGLVTDFPALFEAVYGNKQMNDIILENYSNWCKKNETRKIQYLLDQVAPLKEAINGKTCRQQEKQILETLENNNLDEQVEEQLSSVRNSVVASVFNQVLADDVEVHGMLEKIKEIFLDWSKETPWVQQAGTIETYKEVLASMSLREYFEQEIEIRSFVEEFDDEYAVCKKRLNSSTAEMKLLCFLLVQYNLRKHDYPQGEMSNGFNVRYSDERNGLRIGPVHYFFGLDKTNKALKIGFAGTLVAHEFAHTFVPSNTQTLFENFPKESVKCVTEQFNATCSTFKEVECVANDNFLAENAADVLAFHLGYELFKREFGSKIHDVLPGTNATHQQLFFYGFGSRFCSGYPSRNGGISHSAINIRVNSIVQLPQFQEAFKCSDNSKMMSVKTKECHLYGPLAPKH